MSLLPSFALRDADTVASSTIDIPKEYGIDFETGELTGQIVEGIEALKVWIFMVLHCERYRFVIYSWQYGIELDQYIGKTYTEEYLNCAVKKDVEDALTQNTHIKSIRNFKATVDKDKLHMSFTVNSDIGGFEVNV